MNRSANPNVYADEHVRVEFVELGEGRSGEYNPEDPTDIELLRFDVYVRPSEETEEYTLDLFEADDGTGVWVDPGDASYCCGIPVDATEDQKQAALKHIHQNIGNPPRKLAMQAMSWIALEADGTLFTRSADELAGLDKRCTKCGLSDGRHAFDCPSFTR